MTLQYLDLEILLFGILLLTVGIAMKLISSQKRNWNPQLSFGSVITCIGIASLIMFGLIWLDNKPDSKLKISESFIMKYKNAHKINCL